MDKSNFFIILLLLFDFSPPYDCENNRTISVHPKKRLRRTTFTCPIVDGKWPDPTDCGKFHNCQNGVSTGGWCGPGMSFDVDNQRCEMALAINCKDGDRPEWNPPDGWQGKSTTTTTKKTTTKQTTSTTAIVPLMHKSKTAEIIKEGERCNFKGQIPDKENCANFYYCKDNELRKDACVERQLFDEDSKSCKEFRLVFCNDRPVNEKGKDPCKSKPNGVYPNIENGCSEFFQCNSQRKVKSGECPIGLRFNVLTLRCDWPNNVPVPCGLKANSSVQIKFDLYNSLLFKLAILSFSLVYKIF